MNSSINGTAKAKRKAVRVKGGKSCRPSLVTGIDKPHIKANNSIAPKWRVLWPPHGPSFVWDVVVTDLGDI